jgi:RNA polymerase sigma-70 factor (ECF subfamily)
MADYLHTDDFLRDFAAGKERAFKALFDEYFPRLTLFAHNITSDYAEGEDIASESLTNLMTSYKRWVYGSFTVERLRGHLFLAVRNRCINYLHSFRNKTRAAGTGMLETLSDESMESVEHGATFSEVIALLYEGLKDLPKDKQRALELIFYEKKTYKEAAEAMGLPLSTFKHIRKGGIAAISRKISRQQAMSLVGVFLAVLTNINFCSFVVLSGHC